VTQNIADEIVSALWKRKSVSEFSIDLKFRCTDT